MLKPAQRRDPAAVPRLILTVLALALLWPGLQLSELNLAVLVAPDNLRNMGQFVSGFWPPAHDRDFLELLAQATLLEGILNNLMDNALRYGLPPGEQARSITVELRREPEGVQLWVIDNGPGIAPLERERILQRWVRGEDREWMGEIVIVLAPWDAKGRSETVTDDALDARIDALYTQGERAKRISELLAAWCGRRRATSKILLPLSVQMPAARPYGVLLARVIASSTVRKLITASTGPKISSRATTCAGCTPVMNVGRHQKPFAGSACCPGWHTVQPSLAPASM